MAKTHRCQSCRGQEKNEGQSGFGQGALGEGVGEPAGGDHFCLLGFFQRERRAEKRALEVVTKGGLRDTTSCSPGKVARETKLLVCACCYLFYNGKEFFVRYFE